MTAGASALLVMIGGGTAGIAALTDDETRIVTAAGADRPVPAAPPVWPPVDEALPPPAAEAELGGEGTDGAGRVGSTGAPDAKPVGERADRRTTDEADRTATRAPRVTGERPAPAVARPQPVVVTRTVTEKRAIPYRTRLIRDPELPRGRKRVHTEGIPGEETLRWLVTFTDGRPTDRRLIDVAVTREPQHRVVAFGTRRSKGDGPRDCRPGSDHCFPLGRTAACPAENAESATLPSALLDAEFYLLTPEDLSGLELDPSLLC